MRGRKWTSNKNSNEIVINDQATTGSKGGRERETKHIGEAEHMIINGED